MMIHSKQPIKPPPTQNYINTTLEKFVEKEFMNTSKKNFSKSSVSKNRERM